jgi:DNA-binding response OmpR family regulator
MIDKLRIAMVDDDPHFLDLFERAMYMYQPPVEITRYTSGIDIILSLIQMEVANRPHVILMDLVLPGWSGIEVAQSIRERSGFKTMPILMLTRSERPNEEQRAIDGGLNAFITKPFSYQEMKVLVRRIYDYWFIFGSLPSLN